MNLLLGRKDMSWKLRLLMNMPKAYKRFLVKKPKVCDGRTMDSGMQILLYFIEQRRKDIDYSTVKPETMRNYYNELAGTLEKKPPSIEHKDHSLQVSDQQITIREYIPSDSDNDGRSLLYFHGGGFCIGSIKTHDIVCKFLAKLLNWKVFSVEYRLAPEYPFPIPLEDCDKAMDWLIDNADKLKIDPNRISVGGDSAGGNLSACLCIKRQEEGKSMPERQLLLYPGIDSKGDHLSLKTLNEGYFLTQAIMDWFGDNYLTEEDHDNIYVAPLKYETPEKLPPAVIITAGFDPLRDEGQAYALFLKNAGVKVFEKEYEGMIHGFMNFTIEPTNYKAFIEIAEEFKNIA
ncbi:MAG: alpha/beta hydrolase [Gammaproteobacteria bacterium]|jgi:acetyl esterase|nr:alpha/beta hydrolase [Gammaproteobacteria bacterium]MDG2435024.1 alpha/beta hydrolase [Gammaproteobacteria bacterium]